MSKRLPYGIYEQLVNQVMDESISEISDNASVQIEKMDSSVSDVILGQYIGQVVRRVLRSIEDNNNLVEDRVDFCNALLGFMIGYLNAQMKGNKEIVKQLKNYLINTNGNMLLAVVESRILPKGADLTLVRPTASIAKTSLFTGSSHEPKMEAEIRKEIASCDRIEWLVSFVKWTGLRLVKDALVNFTEMGGKLRIVTTSYMGATDYKAVEWLSRLPNTEVRITYDTERTRLHAKSYVFWRESGFSTAYIGSSNLSNSAMTSGLEWNVKLSENDSKSILDKIQATFESYWNRPEFKSFDPNIDGELLKKALIRARGNDLGLMNSLNVHFFDIKPHYYQQEILDMLEAERTIHGHFRNLVIAATGTGKTVISALDYKKFSHDYKSSKLLFVAHRKEILSQSLQCFRNILRNSNFGGLLVDGLRPDSFDNVFISIQSFNSLSLVNTLDSNYYDYIVIDEFHHAASDSYETLLNHFKPKVLLGLTATPERADGKDIFKYFDNADSIQLRLTEAIDRKLLSPFHYFGITDNLDFQNVRWQSGKYNLEDLENIMVLNNESAKNRAEQVKHALEEYGHDWPEIIGLGFCVSKLHAKFMSDYFNNSGIPSEYLTSDSASELRESVQQQLVSKKINFVFVVDLYNEGVDIPEVNTVLFLRPTESLTVFLQQLGRGLRLCEGKEALTVIDFVGRQRAEYNFESRFRSLMKQTRRSVTQEIKDGFVHVPKGCAIYLEKIAQTVILEHIQNSVNNKKQILRKIMDWKRSEEQASLIDFFKHWHVKPLEVYRIDNKKTTLSGLMAREGISEEIESTLAKGYARLACVRSIDWFRFLLEHLPKIKLNDFDITNSYSPRQVRWFEMLFYTFISREGSTGWTCVQDAFRTWFSIETYFEELLSIIQLTYDQLDLITKPLILSSNDQVLELHGIYTKNQILCAMNYHTIQKCMSHREGVLYLKDQDVDIFFVTLNKSDADYTETTLYDDYAIDEKQFHWQSQSVTTDTSDTGKRYTQQLSRKTKVLMFVRPYNKVDGFTSLYTCVGFVDYVSHNSSAPINIIWELRESMPAYLLEIAAKAE